MLNAELYLSQPVKVVGEEDTVEQIGLAAHATFLQTRQDGKRPTA